MNISPGKRGGIDGSPSFQDWWKLMNFCVTKRPCLAEGDLLLCFFQTFQPNAELHYSTIFKGLLSIHFVLEKCHKDLLTPCQMNVFPEVESSLEDVAFQHLSHYNYDLANSYKPYIKTFNQMSAAWTKHLINQRKYSKISDDGKTGILQWGALENEKVFFHRDGIETFMIHPNAVTTWEPFNLENFHYNCGDLRMTRSFVFSRAEGIQPESFLRLMRMSTGPTKHEETDAFAFKTINGNEEKNPYSSVTFFGGDVDRNIGNIHTRSSSLYPLIKEFLGARDSCLLPLTDSSEDPLDIYALELEIADILSQQSQVRTEETAQASLPLEQPRVEVLDEEEVAPPPTQPEEPKKDRPSSLPQKREKPSKPLKAFRDSFIPPSEKSYTTKEMQIQIEAEIFIRAVKEQVQREQDKVAPRVQKMLESEQNRGRGSRGKKNTQQHEEASAPSSPTQSSHLAINLKQIQHDVGVELNKRRVRYRDMARLITGVMQTLPPERLEALSENARGSHLTLHAEAGTTTATLVRPHGSNDLTMPGYRARSIASSIIGMLMEASRLSDLTRRK